MTLIDLFNAAGAATESTGQASNPAVTAASAVTAEEYSPLVLAYLGDAVFELLIRTKVVGGGNAPVKEMSQSARNRVNAAAQSAYYSRLLPVLDDAELAILKRGRNAKSYSRAKNATALDYRRATGFEALFGYLFLKGQIARVIELFDMIFKEP